MTKDELRKKANELPLLPGVYIMKNKNDEIIYIGKAKALKNRVTQYFGGGSGHTAKVRKMVSNVDHFEYIVCDSEFEALVLECSLIKLHTPKYNILLKDDKGYSYVKITRGDYPRISAALQKDDDEADYIGPFTAASRCARWWKRPRIPSCCPAATAAFPRTSARAAPASTPTSASAWRCAAAR